jgi:hypothetical protein
MQVQRTALSGSKRSSYSENPLLGKIEINTLKASSPLSKAKVKNGTMEEKITFLFLIIFSNIVFVEFLILSISYRKSN